MKVSRHLFKSCLTKRHGKSSRSDELGNVRTGTRLSRELASEIRGHRSVARIASARRSSADDFNPCGQEVCPPRLATAKHVHAGLRSSHAGGVQSIQDPSRHRMLKSELGSSAQKAAAAPIAI